jgi:hypothetical protein
MGGWLDDSKTISSWQYDFKTNKKWTYVRLIWTDEKQYVWETTKNTTSCQHVFSLCLDDSQNRLTHFHDFKLERIRPHVFSPVFESLKSKYILYGTLPDLKLRLVLAMSSRCVWDV